MSAETLDRIRARLDLLRALHGAPAAENPYALYPPLPAEGLAAAEARLGATLPEEYRSFIVTLGDGGAGPHAGLYPADRALTPIPGPRAPGASPTSSLARPFPLSVPFQPRGPKDVYPIPAGAHLYDGCLRLTDLDNGGMALLLVSGPRRGEVWRDESAQRGPITPLAPGFFAWFGEWTCAQLHAEAVTASQRALAAEPSEDARALFARLLPMLDEQTPHARLALAWVRLALGEHGGALAIEEELSGQPLTSRTLRRELEKLARALHGEALALADDPEADPLALDALASHGSPRVRAAVAGHAQLTLAAQSRLSEDGWSITEPLAQNPALAEEVAAALLARAAAQVEAQPEPSLWWTLEALCHREALPEALRAALWTLARRLDAEPGGCLSRGFALRPDLRPEEARALLADPRPAVRHGLSLNPGAPPEVLSELVDDASPEVLRGLSRNPSLPEEAQLRLCRDQTDGVAGGLASHSASRRVRDRLSRGGQPWVVAALAENPHVSPSELETHADYPHREVRRRVACHPSTPARALRTLLAVEEGALRRFVATNPNLDPEALESLCNDGSHGVREALAQNPALTQEQLSRYGLLPGRTQQLAQSPSLTFAQREAMREDPSEDVREAINRALLMQDSTPDTLRRQLAREHFTTHPHEGRAQLWRRWPEAPAAWVVRAGLPWHPSYPGALAEAMLTDPEQVGAAALCPWLTPAQLAQAAQQEAGREGAAANPSTPREALQAMAGDAREGVRAEVARNPSTPFAVREALAEDPSVEVRRALVSCPSLSAMFVVRFFSDENQDVRVQVAQHGSLTPDLLSRLARDRVALVRAAVALNPETPRGTLQQLTLDIEPSVRDAALWRSRRGWD